MDTTSHEFNWEIFTFGDGSSSVLKDVAIINKNEIWAVGEIYVYDSTGSEVRYNAVYWNGQDWNLKRIPYIYNSQPYYSPMNFTFSFDNGEVWYGGNGIVKWDGNSFSNVEIDQSFWGPVAINKIWGSSTMNVFIIGDEGSIAHFNGSVWQKIETGTDVNLLDVWGSPDGSVVWACGTEVGKPTVLLRHKNGILETIYKDNDYLFEVREDTLSGRLVSVWTVNNRYYYVLSSIGLYRLSIFGNEPIQRLSFRPNLFPGFPRRVRGSRTNDLTIVGGLYMIAHYNGYSWKHYDEHMDQGRFFSVYQKENLIVAVGHSADLLSKGVILVGRR